MFRPDTAPLRERLLQSFSGALHNVVARPSWCNSGRTALSYSCHGFFVVLLRLVAEASGQVVDDVTLGAPADPI